MLIRGQVSERQEEFCGIPAEMETVADFSEVRSREQWQSVSHLEK